jgi:ATP-dependent helicase/nuclease subunit A
MPVERPELTSEQIDAVATSDVSVALSAGAGCGKTFVLTQRFLKQLAPECGRDPLHGTVAITFTERAAREMRDRIRGACHQELMRCPAGEVDHWQKIVRGLDAARISTIHSFCASLLRSFAVDAGIDPGFGLLDAATATAFLRGVVDETVRDLLSRGDEGTMQLVFVYGLERTKEHIQRLVQDRFRIEFGRFQDLTAEMLADEWLKRWREECVPQLRNKLIEADATQRLVTLLKAHEPAHAEMQRRRVCLLELLSGSGDAAELLPMLETLRSVAQVKGGGGKQAWDDEETYKEVMNQLTELRNSIDKMMGDLCIEHAQVQATAEIGLIAVRVTHTVAKRYDAMKNEAGLVDFDDLLLLTRDLLRDSPSVRSRAACGIKYLLVDEFQDTDPVQSEIVRQLCGERLLDGKLFLVGDVKQSIYRFRRADPGVFSALREEIPSQGRLPLTTNFRSQPSILHFINCLFAASMGTAYEPLRPFDSRQLSPTPAIEFLFASGEASAKGEREKVEERRIREADWIARRIRTLLEETTSRIREVDPDSSEAKLRPARQGDIAILFRTLRHVAIYEEALRSYGIDYYLVGGRAFYAQQEIHDLVNLCRYLDERDDEIALAGVLRSPFFSLRDETLYALVENAGTLQQSLTQDAPNSLPADQRRQFEYAADVLAELLRKKDRLPLAKLLNLAVERTGYDAALLNEFLGRRKIANLHKLIEIARQFDRTGFCTLKDFVERLRDSLAEQTDEELAPTHPETSDVVRLMTVHQAKGLEFPVVFVADMDWKMQGSGAAARFHPELGPLLPPALNGAESQPNLGRKIHKLIEDTEDRAETMRLLYVATTRAADYLILSAGLQADRKPRSPWLGLLAERFNLETGLPAIDPYLGRISLGEVVQEEIPEIRVHHDPPAVSGFTKPLPDGRLPLAELPQAVAQVEPALLPEMIPAICPDARARRQLSVSAIEDRVAKVEEADSERRGGQSGGSQSMESSHGGIDSGDRAVAVATDLGTLVHRVLERIDFGSPQPVATLVEACLRSQSRAGDDVLRSAALRRIETFLNSGLSAEVADASLCYRELDFRLRWPIASQSDEPLTIAGTIDCLLRSPEGKWKILDYKTGHAPKDNPAAFLAKYRVQLVLYALAVRELIGRWPDGIEVIRLEEQDTRSIPFELTDQIVAATSQQIDVAIEIARRETAPIDS